jgi:hypothetical protein
MLRVKFRSALTAITLTAATLAIPVVTAAPAQASPSSCEQYLKSAGYIVGPKVQHACFAGGPVTGSGFWLCYAELAKIGVRDGHASAACNKAAQPW